MVKFGCGKPLDEVKIVYYGLNGVFARVIEWTDVRACNLEENCGSFCENVDSRIRSQYCFCEDCARKLGWIW